MALTAADVARMPSAAQKQIAAKLVGEAQRKERKYRNEPTVSHGITFDSKKEARRYEELLLMLKAGTIRRLKLQVDFTSARVGVAEKPPALRDLPPPVQALRMVERAHGLLLPPAAWEVEQAAHRAGH